MANQAKTQHSSYEPRHAGGRSRRSYGNDKRSWAAISSGSTRRAWLTALDQGIASASNFAIGAVVGRVTGPSGLGAFALAYTGWILLINLHRSLITDPMAILGDVRDQEREARLRTGLAGEMVLAVFAMAILSVAGALLALSRHVMFGDGLLALAPWVAVLNVQDYWRWAGFLLGKPEKALMNDLLFDVVQAIAFVTVLVSHTTSVFAVVGAWGIGASAAALYGLRQFRLRPTLRGGLGLLWTRWRLSKWLVSASFTSWASGSVSSLVVASLLGASALGGLKAGNTLAWGPLAIVMQAGTSFGLPEASRMLADRGRQGLRKVSRLISGVGAGVAVLSLLAIVVDGRGLLRLLYGAPFARYWTVTVVLAISFILTTLTLGPVLSLKALARVRPLFVVQLGTTVVSLGATVIGCSVWGLEGAAAATVMTACVSLGAILLLLHRVTMSGVAVA